MISVEREPVASLGLPQMHTQLPGFASKIDSYDYMFVCVLHALTGDG